MTDRSLLARIRARIDRVGPLPFDEYMGMALYDPADGFFTAGGVRSSSGGDFLTSPEVSSLFGETLATWVQDVWQRAGAPSSFIVCDAGAGSGSLLAPLLGALDFEPDVHAIEISPAARVSVRRRIPHAALHGSIEELPAGFAGVVIANELLDNLPMALAMRTPGGWEERNVGWDGEQLVFVAGPVRPRVAAWLARWAGPVEPGGLVEVQLGAERWVEQVVRRLGVGALAAFDYGELFENLAHRRATGTLRTYQGHHLGPHPLFDPGGTDITADVNLSPLVDAATRAGARVELHRQDDFLRSWGLGAVREDLRGRELELARSHDALARLTIRSRVTDADTLLHPRGLGDFRALIADKCHE